MSPTIRPSRVLACMRSGKTAICTKVNLNDPTIIELAGIAGFDAIWLDMEHVPNDWLNLVNQVRAVKLYDMDTVVRVSKGSYSDLIRPFEADAIGIMYPHLMSLAEAKTLVYHTKFHPLGRRPIDGGNLDGKFCQVSTPEYIKTVNEERFVIVQIEDPEPLEELEEIIKLEGIDMVFFGPGDFSQGIGKPGELNHPKVTQTRKRMVELCQKHHRFTGTVATIENLKEIAEMGFNFVNVGADVIGLGQYWNGLMKTVRQIVGT